MSAETALAVLSVAAAGLAPAISVRFVSGRYLDAARDVWLVGLAWLAALALCLVSLPLGLLSVAVVAHWRRWEQLPAVLTWAGIVATWFLVQGLPPWAQAAVPGGWRVTAALLIAMGWAQRQRRQEFKATTGSRINLAALLVLVWPFTSPWEWPLYAYALWRTSSWFAVLALFAAVSVRYPVTTPWVLAAFAVLVALFLIPPWRRGVIDRTPRGGSFDGLRTRLRTWGALLRLGRRWPIWLIGSGPNPAGRHGPGLERDLAREALRLSQLRGVDMTLATSPVHCEPLEIAYTYGLLGVAAMGAFAWQLWPRLAWGDPWSACVVAGAVLACTLIPARVAPVGLIWLCALAVVAGR